MAQRFLSYPGAFAVTETGPDGYAGSIAPECSGTVVLGESYVCVITNDDIQPQLFVRKVVDNTNGGTLVPIDVSLQVTSATTGAIAPVVGTDSLPGTAVGINAGAYSVAEVVVPDGYDASYSAGCSGSVTVGQNPMPVCTVTNTC